MIRIVFSEEEVTQLQDLSTNHPHSFVRRKALALLLKSQEIAHHKIAKIINVCGNTICSYFKAYLCDRASSVTTERDPDASVFEKIGCQIQKDSWSAC